VSVKARDKSWNNKAVARNCSGVLFAEKISADEPGHFLFSDKKFPAVHPNLTRSELKTHTGGLELSANRSGVCRGAEFLQAKAET
jgi:hypothetical protein